MNQTHTGTRRFPVDPWKITETHFNPDDYRLIEAIMALSNGYLGQRASFEEGASKADSLRGNYIAGVFDSYPNPTMVKLKGRPANPSEMVNVPDFLPVLIKVNGTLVDLTRCTVESYARTLHMDTGVLTRDAICRLPEGERVRLEFVRFLSRVRRHVAAIQVRVTPLDADTRIDLISMINGDVSNVNHKHLKDSALHTPHERRVHGLTCSTRSTGIRIAIAAFADTVGPKASVVPDHDPANKRCRIVFSAKCAKGEPLTIEKIVAVATSRDNGVQGDPLQACLAFLDDARAAVGAIPCGRPGQARGPATAFAALIDEHRNAWAEVWRAVEIEIKDKSGACGQTVRGDLTQGLHYAIFQMIQNAPGDDLANIGAKGLTGEHYYGTYFWDTEIFMLPMFGFIMPEVARNLVKSRAMMLPGARRKAEEMDLKGAAFPFMADADGNECCTLWQFGLLGIHVTADVAWGVWFYYCTSGDLDFIADGGIDIMVETSRFWLSRAFFRRDIGKYVINRVLGPDEYHQGVDNNFYTNIMAQENLLKTCRLLDILKAERPEAYQAAIGRLGLWDDEPARFQSVAERIHLPRDEKLGINLQDDTFHLLEPWDLKANPLPGAIPAIWSYDRAMRTQLLRQADIVVAHILLGDRFTPDQMLRDFEFYEPKTTHDSSLSFCSYSIAAARLGKTEMAYDYFLRTARLNLDDIHGNTWMGIHTACLGGAWQCVVLGFGGVRWYDGTLSLDPILPPQWDEFSFSIWWHGTRISVTVRDAEVILHTDGKPVELTLHGRPVHVTQNRMAFPAAK